MTGTAPLSLPLPGAPAPGTQMSLPEATQWTLRTGENSLQYAWPESAAAALIELVLAGRIDSEPGAGLFRSPMGRKIVVVDASPTGHPELDVVLDFLAKRAKPKKVLADFWEIGDLASSAVQKRLFAAGAVEKMGEFRLNSSYLVVRDIQRHQLAQDWLQRVRANPDAVADAREGALRDILGNTYRKFAPDRVSLREIDTEWYPAKLRPTIEAILQVESAETATMRVTS